MTDKLAWSNITVSLGDLKPWASNPKFSTKAQALRIIDSFKKFGQVMTVAVSPTLDVYDGHQRLSALLTIHGADYQIDARQSNRPLTDAERRELVITLHTAAVGSYDWQALSGWDTTELKGWGMDSDVLKGWNNDASNLKELLRADDVTADTEAETDRAAELLEKWQVKTGDLWQLGEHRLICGDCTDAATVARVMQGEKADLTFTSPPYNGNTTMYDYIIVDGKKKRKDKTLYADNETDNKTSDEYIKFCHSVIDVCFQVTHGFIFWNINYNAKSRFEYIDSVYPYRHKLHETIVWKKNAIPTANGFTRNHEFIFMLRTDDDLGHLNQEYDVVHTLWDINNINSQQEEHKACFPVELPEKAIQISDRTKVVFDPFLGSGTTLIACENLSRRCRAIEISPAYVAVALERWSQHTGQTPVRLSD